MALDSQTLAFVFPMASGHINPSLPVARQLVESGYRVHFLCVEQFREPIEDTGAAFHSVLEEQPELYEGRQADPFGAMGSLMQENGLQGGPMVSLTKLKHVMLELQLPGMLRFLRRLRPSAVVLDALFSREAAISAQIAGIPAVPLLTVAGPGAMVAVMEEMLQEEGMTFERLKKEFENYEPGVAALMRLNAAYGLSLQPGLALDLFDTAPPGSTVLVTTSEDLQDPLPAELDAAYSSAGISFAALGPLLDREGAKRAGGHRTGSGEQAGNTTGGCDSALARVQAARRLGRDVVLVSMGTVITGDSKLGWEGRKVGIDGQPRGLTGRELCRAAWAGAFDAFGARCAEDGPLIVVSLGPQQDPLGDLEAPPNAICQAFVPQVDILKAGVRVFLTHGGQNSLTEALATATPVVVCPGFGDQVVNGSKAVALGVGLKADRPDPDAGGEVEAAAVYRAGVCRKLCDVVDTASCQEAAAACAERLLKAGGVQRAVELVLRAAAGDGPAEKQLSQPLPRVTASARAVRAGA